MSFPSIRSQITDNATGNETTHTISLPATIAAGDTILVLIRVTVAGAIGWPDASWIELFDASDDAADDQMAAAWKKADGSEGGTTIDVTSGNGKFTSIAIAVKDATDPTITPPTLGTVATGSGTEPNAGNCNPAAGTKDYLWWTFYGMEGEQTGITSYPANYTLNQSGIVTTGTGGAVTTNCTMASAARQLNASAEDAGVWDVTGTLDDWTAYTIAFHPAEPVTAGLENSRRYNPDVMLRTPASIGAVLTLAVNLLQTTLAPEAAPVFVSNTELPQVAEQRRRTHVNNNLNNTLEGQDENHYTQFDVLIRNKFSIGINELTQVNNLLQTTLQPEEANPFIPIIYPNPQLKGIPPSHISQDFFQFLFVESPFNQTNWPNPQLKGLIRQDWIQERKQYYEDNFPFRNDLPNPQLKKAGEGFIFNKQIEEEEANPFVPILFPNPGIKERVRQDWIQERKQFYEDNTPFKNDLPNPLLKRAGEGFIFSPQIREEEELPIIPPIFNNPEVRRRIAETWINNITIPIEIIFRQNDHPNPRIGSRNFHSGWTQTIKLAEDQVIIRNLLPNPILKVRIAESHVVNLLQSTLDPGVGEKPHSQNDWPLPLRKKIHPAWEDFYRFEDNAPTVGIYTTLPPALKRKPVQDWIDNPIEVLTAIAGQKPVGTIELPAFITLKRKIPIEILTIRGRIFIIIPPNIIGREICLESKLDEYSLESALAEYDINSRIEIFDLESGGQDCE